MSPLSTLYRVGTRASKLARVQTHEALTRLAMLLPCLRFEEVPFRTPGDRDLRSDLRESPPDFFTRDLDEAITDGRLDAALHSAKDLPDPMPAGLDWCWLPGAEDARDVLVLRQGMTCADLSDHPIVTSAALWGRSPSGLDRGKLRVLGTMRCSRKRPVWLWMCFH